ncbi:radical SAM protein [Leptospira sp. 201903071]|uniref:B12-binding domain-containing radical SAM protein n=1 Tax=Leptospira ainazelensis TaxID=2810034 RepID=UPI0019626BB8|nr:radical SAM protein [Leptospira ainazelensis]MBM9502385.1 radical SAM protein [Leptospira ainazelensis]
MEFRPVAIVQLPFPSQQEPLEELNAYYIKYMECYKDLFPEYGIESGDLWELPLWVAHIDGALNFKDTVFLDFSRFEFEAELIVSEILKSVEGNSIILFSPLSQNYDFCISVSKSLRNLGFKTVIGGNMSDFANPHDFDLIHRGIIKGGFLHEINNERGVLTIEVQRGRNKEFLNYSPSYRLLSHYNGRIPLIRLNASHGCLFDCSFCGDSWTKQLHLVEQERLAMELDQLIDFFPDTRILYIGDKTFGQSKAAVETLSKVLEQYGNRFKLIVQTHVTMINDFLIDRMKAFNVQVVEMGFETADSEVLKQLHKYTDLDLFKTNIQKLNDAGIKVILNVLGGLPYETRKSLRTTVNFLEETSDYVWLYNLYNFVPYPKTPIYISIKDRIVDWNFNNWREDKPIVFEPFLQSRSDSWNNFLELIQLGDKLVGRKLYESKRL